MVSPKAPSRLAALSALGIGVVNGALPLLLPLPPGQDTPQHLAYGKILATHAAESPLATAYAKVPGFHPYFLVHHALALAPHGDVVTLGRAAFVLYALAMIAAFALLTAVLARRDDGRLVVPWAALAGVLVVWNPVVWMGFLPFLFAMPLALAAYACLLRGTSERSGRWLAAGAGLAFGSAMLHVVAGAGIFALVAARAVCAPRRERRRALLATALAALAAVLPFAFVGAAAASVSLAPSAREIVEAVGREGGSAFTRLFAVDWGEPATKAAYVGIAAFGTLPPGPKVWVAGVLLVAMMLLATLAALRAVPRRAGTAGARWAAASARADLGAALVFLALALLAPAALKVPTDIAFLDYRLVALAVAVLFAHAARLETRAEGRLSQVMRGSVALAVAALATGVWATVFLGLRAEQRPFERLVATLGEGDRVLALPIDDTSAMLDPQNTTMHYWPLAHTARNGGLTSQFWGRFSPHLPVGHRPGFAFPAPPDWDPLAVGEEHLAFATHVLATFPLAEPDEAQRARIERARSLVEAASSAWRCERNVCLFALRPARQGVESVTAREEHSPSPRK